jgi:primosomal protein N' (replication factor Y)
MVETILKQGQQVLVLVPEIGLTPQTLARFQQRFQTQLAVFHSNVSAQKKLMYWQKAKEGIAPIIIGTRSAIFTPIKNLGLIIVDEEHDLSYKQQDTLRYNAKDLACVRAQHHKIPVILGSATPSLESLYNTESNKFKHWIMEKRAGTAQKAAIEIFDIKQAAMHEGIAESLLPRIDETLRRDEQVLLFVNRRGFAPTLLCHDCGWIHQCHACDARMTVHRQAAKSQCHHCGAVEWTPKACPECKSTSLESVGAGTERLTLFMQNQFKGTPCYRIDRDTTGTKGQMDDMLTSIKNQKRAILIGTQMLAKGHHLPNVTLVIIVDADSGLMGADFRSLERFGQLVTQVIGRAGRGDKKGNAIIQTHYPEHEQLQKLIHFGYRRFAMDILSERKPLGLPPFQYMALIRLEAQDQQEAAKILSDMIHQTAPHHSQVLGPFSAGLARRAHFFRFQVMIKATSRGARAHTVNAFLALKPKLIKARHRFSIDIDPLDMA